MERFFELFAGIEVIMLKCTYKIINYHFNVRCMLNSNPNLLEFNRIFFYYFGKEVEEIKKYVGRIFVPVLFFILILPFIGWMYIEVHKVSTFAGIYIVAIVSIAWLLGATYDKNRKMIELLKDSEGRYRIF